MRFRSSLYRVTTRSAFMGLALFVGLVLWYLPSFLNLDSFRPALINVLETTFHCKVLVGPITGQLVPTPGLIISHVVFLDDAKSPHVLASVAVVHLSVAPAPLLKDRLEISDIRFVRPRFIVHQVLDSAGESQWLLLHLPRLDPSASKEDIKEWQIRNGSIELWDHTTSPTTKWIGEQFTGSYRVHEQTGAIVGKFVHRQHRMLVDIHYDGANPLPLQVLFDDVDLGAFQPLVHSPLFTLEGPADILFKIRLQPSLKIHADLNQPAGIGQVTADSAPGRHGLWHWSAEGHHYALKGTAFEFPEWSAKSDPEGFSVYMRGTTKEGGMAEVVWTREPGTTDTTLGVDVSSVTIRQILEIFKVQSKTQPTALTFNPHGYEPWRIDRGSMQAVVHAGSSFEVKESDIDLIGGMHLDLQGTFDLVKTSATARIQGDLVDIPVASIIESFFAPPAPLTGTSEMEYTLSFPLTPNWVAGLTGPVQLDAKNGVLRTLKTAYRIESVLNLGNYLRLRLPKINSQGIEFETLAGHLMFQNGVLSADDLFLKSPNMNIGAKGSLDIPGKRIHTTLRLEMLRFLEDILRDVPFTHWIFKKPNKIFLPVVVTVDGPWDNPDVR